MRLDLITTGNRPGLFPSLEARCNQRVLLLVRSRGAGRGAGAPRVLRPRGGVAAPCGGTRPTGCGVGRFMGGEGRGEPAGGASLPGTLKPP